MKKYILAIDQGTTGSRAIVYDRAGRRVAGSYREFPQYFPRPGWVEHDPEEIWQSVRASVQNVLRRVPGHEIAAIGITNQRETTVVWDRASGRPVHRAIVWQCRRTAERCQALARRPGMSRFVAGRTGLPIDAYFSASKIQWILENVPAAHRRAQQGDWCFGTTDSWVLWKLTGGAVHATDYTNASRTMLFNIRKLCWDPALLKTFTIPPAMLPDVKCSAGIFGYTVPTGALPGGIPVAGIAGDQQAALFGQTCFNAGSLKNTYGTGSFILLNTGTRYPVSKHGLIVTRGCDRFGKPAYVLEGSIFVTGAAIQWLRDGLRILRKAGESGSMARAERDTAGVYFVPALAGLGAPYWDSNARGSIVGITRGTNRNHLVRAALEAMCYQTRDVIEAMRKDSGLRIGTLKIDGGAAANDFLCQYQADILGIDVIRPRIIEITSLGAAYLAGLAVGYWKNSDAIKKLWKVDRVFKPRMSKQAADKAYQRWQTAVDATRRFT